MSPVDETCDFAVVLSDKLATVEECLDGDPAGAHVIAVHGPGRFLGELSVLRDLVAQDASATRR